MSNTNGIIAGIGDFGISQIKDEAVDAKDLAVSAKNTAISAKDTAVTKASEASASATSASASATSAQQSEQLAAQHLSEIYEAGFQSEYNPTTNTPTLSATPNPALDNGAWYLISSPGTLSFATSNFPSGQSVVVGDKLRKKGSQWVLDRFLIANKSVTTEKIAFIDEYDLDFLGYEWAVRVGQRIVLYSKGGQIFGDFNFSDRLLSFSDLDENLNIAIPDVFDFNPDFHPYIIACVDIYKRVIWGVTKDFIFESNSNLDFVLEQRSAPQAPTNSSNVIFTDENKRVSTSDSKSYKQQLAYLSEVQLADNKKLLPVTKTDICVISNKSTSSSLTGNIIAPLSGNYTYKGGNAILAGSTYPNNLFVISNHVTGQYQTPPYNVEFLLDADEFELYYMGSGGECRLLVENSIVTEIVTPIDGNLYFQKFQFNGGKAKRIVRIECSDNFKFGGIKIKNTDSVAPSYLTQKRVIVVGDSFAEPAGVPAWNGFGNVLGNILNWDVWQSGSGGTGYVNTGTSIRYKFRDRLPADVLPYNPGKVILAGGINDTTLNINTFETEVQSCIDYLKANLPSCEIIIVGNWYPRSSENGTWDNFLNVLRKKAKDNNLLFINPKGWITGNGKIGNENQSGNSDIYIQSDGTHPTEAGQIYLGQKLAKEIISQKTINSII